MKKVFVLSVMLFVASIMMISACAKETVVYENDFTSSSFADFQSNGNWIVESGVLTTGSGSGSAFLTYTFPEKYAGCAYQVDVDFIGHTSTGGIMIGATGTGLSAVPESFFGFDCFTSKTGDKAALGCYKANGAWNNNIAVSDVVMSAGSDIHLTVRVEGNYLTYRVTSLDGKDDYYGIEYTIGQSSLDIYSEFSRTVGLRKFYTDKGYFDNFKVTVFEDDIMPSMSQKIDFGGISFDVGGLAKSGNAVSGIGAMLTASAADENFKASVMLSPAKISKLLFGMTDDKNGYAFSINKNDETVGFYKITDGKYSTLGLRRMPVGDGPYLTYVSVHNGIATAFFDAYSNGEGTFPAFEFELDGYTIGRFGIWLEGGEVSDFTLTESVGKSGETYINPIFEGADPEIIYHDGTYYAYRRVSAGNGVVRVYTSPDLVNWIERNIVYTQKADYTGSSYMSPNVLYNESDGLFYLFIAGNNKDKTGKCIYYAYSGSPYGPFEHAGGVQTTLHTGVSEIGGAPFVDDDGKTYLTYCRFGNGNHIYIEEFNLKDGLVAPVLGTLRKVISPSEYYEIDGHGHISEGGIITKHNGLYYMIYASGHYLGNYGASYAVAKNILGPYEKYEYNEIMTHNSFVDGVGDCIFVRSPDQSELWVAYHQHYKVGIVEPRQTRIDKVRFVKDPNGGPDIMTVNGPSTVPQTVPSNAYKYDTNRDGKLSLLDALTAAKFRMTREYSGIYDVVADGVVNLEDSKAILIAIINQ